MTRCKHCGRRSKNGNQYCSGCGFRLPRGKRPWLSKAPPSTSLLKFTGKIGVTVSLFFVAAIVFLFLNRDTYSNPDIMDQPQVTETMDYGEGTLFMTPVESRIAEGNILIPVRTVIEKKLIRFEYMDGSQPLPIMAYITPSGRLVTAVSLCKPCGATRYYIKDDRMACDVCNSKWDPETLIGLAGGCRAYPPELLPSYVRDGQVVIDETLVKGWLPKA